MRLDAAVHWMRGQLAGLEQEILDLYWKARAETNLAAQRAYIDEYHELLELRDQLNELMRRAGQATPRKADQ